jgi:hypothetical protein
MKMLNVVDLVLKKNQQFPLFELKQFFFLQNKNKKKKNLRSIFVYCQLSNDKQSLIDHDYHCLLMHLELQNRLYQISINQFSYK